ncbi:MAG: polysaccharide deacetylase family protein [Nitrospirae bacterium]|nr:polysaccharide deacetylase family protein [Nitrospirota bacterium]
MRLKRQVAKGVAEAVSLVKGISAHQKGLRILLYHSVGTELPHDTYGISINSASFDRHMALLKGMEDIQINSMEGALGDDKSCSIAVTFDDGYKDNLYVAAPILSGYGIPFTVFVTGDFIKGNVPFYLTPTELKALSLIEGVRVGSHGLTHRRLTQCSDKELWEELHGSRCYLEDVIGRPVTAISYPHGSVNRRVWETAREAGYEIGACSRFGVNSADCDNLLLRRTEIVAEDSERILFQKINGAWDWYGWLQKNPQTE